MTSKYGKPNAIKLLMLTPPLSEARSGTARSYKH